MADKPILFAPPMVLALLREIEKQGTGETMTRRVLKPQPIAPWFWEGDEVDPEPGWFDYWTEGQEPCGAPTREVTPALEVRYQPGDRCYVRESLKLNESDELCFGADWAAVPRESMPAGFSVSRRSVPGIFMPRWASRITLYVEDVRVERIQDISAKDAKAEGPEWFSPPISNECFKTDEEAMDAGWLYSFALLWDQLNEKRGYGWEANPWVAAYTFRPVMGNIDSLEAA